MNPCYDAIDREDFSDNEGNHLLVALYFCNSDYKLNTLHIPEEFAYIKVVDIDITKAYVDRPINPSVFFRMSTWLMQMFMDFKDAIFTFICSLDELETNHPEILPQNYRWVLFDRLYQRLPDKSAINVQDIIIGPDDFKSYGRAFYHDQQAPIVHIVVDYLKEKQQQYQ